jgi:hypothetical protein
LAGRRVFSYVNRFARHGENPTFAGPVHRAVGGQIQLMPIATQFAGVLQSG